MENDNEKEKLLYEQSKFYEKKIMPVHVKTIDKFYNGILLEVNPNYIIINDDVIGQIPIWFKEIYKISPKRLKEKK
jgi:hypothetical protein